MVRAGVSGDLPTRTYDSGARGGGSARVLRSSVRDGSGDENLGNPGSAVDFGGSRVGQSAVVVGW